MVERSRVLERNVLELKEALERQAGMTEEANAQTLL